MLRSGLHAEEKGHSESPQQGQYSIKHLAKMSKGSVQGSARQSLAEHLNRDQWFKEAGIYWFLALMTGLHKTI